jgi:hypothetical protein
MTSTPEFKDKFTWKKTVLPLTRGLSSGQLRVLESIFNHSDGGGRGSHPGRPRIAEETGLSVKQVGRNLDVLKERGLIECVRKGNRRIKLNDVYELRTPQKEDVIKDIETPIKDISDVHKGPPEVPPTDPMNRSSVTDPFERDIGDVPPGGYTARVPLVSDHFEAVESGLSDVEQSQPCRSALEGHLGDVPLPAKQGTSMSQSDHELDAADLASMESFYAVEAATPTREVSFKSDEARIFSEQLQVEWDASRTKPSTQIPWPREKPLPSLMDPFADYVDSETREVFAYTPGKLPTADATKR